MKELNQLLKDFEKKFGFETYEALKKMMASMYIKIGDLTASRDKWKKKYYLLREGKE